MQTRKRMLSLLLAVLTLFSCVPPASAAGEKAETQYKITSASVRGTTLTWSATLPNDGRSVSAIAAWYCESGRLRGVKVDKLTANGTVTDWTLEVGADAAWYKLLLLDSTSCAPLCGAWNGEAQNYDVRTIIAPQYEAAQQFSDGYAAVKLNGKWGYIDESGKMVVPAKYDRAGVMSEGIAVVGVNGTYTYIDDYDGTEHSEDVCYLYLVYPDGSEKQLEMPDSNNPFYKNTPLHKSATDSNDSTFQDSEMTEAYIPADAAEGSFVQFFCTGGVVRAASLPYRKDGTLIEVKDYDVPFGDQPCVFAMTGACVNGVIPMHVYMLGRSIDAGCEAFLMDSEGTVLRTFPFCSGILGAAGPLWVSAPEENGLIVFDCGYMTDNERWTFGVGAINQDVDLNDLLNEYGSIDDYEEIANLCVIQPKYIGYRYNFAGKYFFDGIWVLQNRDEKWGALDTQGNTVIPFEYDFLTSFREGMAGAIKDGKGFFIDLDNKRYEIEGVNGGTPNITAMGVFRDGIAAVYDAASGKAYCVRKTAEAGNLLTRIRGTEQLSLYSYFPDYDGEMHTVTTVSDIIVIEENGRFGYARLTLY